MERLEAYQFQLKFFFFLVRKCLQARSNPQNLCLQLEHTPVSCKHAMISTLAWQGYKFVASLVHPFGFLIAEEFGTTDMKQRY